MTKSKTTKRALLLSVISMLLCLSMLVGSTFAWFTDSVTSGKNKIVAGNLDVVLEYRDADGTWKPVTASTTLFDDSALWEPGHTEVAYLHVKNAGTLDLKYKLNINVYNEKGSTNVNGDPFNLSDHLVFGKVDMENAEAVYENTDAGRAAARADAGNVRGLTAWSREGNLYANPTATGEVNEQYIALVIYMPESVGNEANYKTAPDVEAPYIEMGINVAATQLNSESDSFGPDYDTGAVYPVLPDPIDVKVTGSILAATETTLEDSTSKTKIVVPAGAVDADTGATFSMVLTESAADSATYEISLTKEDGTPVTLNSFATVTVQLPKNLKNVQVAHDGTPMTVGTGDGQYKYNADSGKLLIYTSSFSPFQITYEQDTAASVNGVSYKTLGAAIKAAQDGDTIVCHKDTNVTTKSIEKNITIDLNGHTLKNASTQSCVLNIKDANVTVKNGTLSASHSRQTADALMVTGKSDVTVENCTLNTTTKGITVVTNGSESLESKIVIRNSTISAPTANNSRGWAAYIPAGDVTFENCNVTGHVHISGGNVTLDGGIYTATGINNQDKIWNGQESADYIIKIGSGNALSVGDSILITDRRAPDAYKIKSLTIQNITFNTEIKLKGGTMATSYAIRYVDLQESTTSDRVNYIIQNNTYNNQIDGADPVMFIDINGNPITNP